MPLLPLLAVSCLLLALSPLEVGAQDRQVKRARASRVPEGTIRIDGRLDEDAWQSATPITEFVQKEPEEGAPARDPIDVRFLFDDTALYVGARMTSSATIQAPLGRRDEGDQSEHLHVSLDTYLDRRTSSTFGITATGVRLDHFHRSDDEQNDDQTFNPVWQGRTSIDASGWTAELWIPFSQLRFNDTTPQVWGLNVRRWIPSRNEESFWSPIRRTDERWASLFGELQGLDGIRPRRRLELLPYVAGNSILLGDRDPADPFNGGANVEGRVGGDIKLGIGSNLTLEATVNPDFGQVEVDPAEVNLSAFETFFEERRPFFVEGNNLLTGNINNYFYSRRIGASPAGRASGDFVDVPGTTTILGAAKLTGRLASGTSIGLLGAVTDHEDARTFTRGLFGRVAVAPGTEFAVARVQQEVGEAGSTVALMTTMVHRHLEQGDALASLLTRNAFTASGDSVLRFGDYETQAFIGVSHVSGERAAIERVQRASARYFQRPDATYVRFDPARTSLSGAKGGVSIERQNARHWTWESAASFESPEFETNDIGRLSSSDGIALTGEVEYQETQPGRLYREYSLTLGHTQEWNYAGDRQTSQIAGNGRYVWPNFWEIELSGTYDFRRQNMRLTRGGPSMEAPAAWEATFEFETSDAAQTQANATVIYGRSEDSGLNFSAEAGFTVRPAPRWQLSVTPRYQREVDTQQYVATLSGGGAATYGSRYVFGEIDRSTYSAQLRFNYTFKPDLTLDVYTEPFAASGQYRQLGELAAARGRLLIPVDPAGLGLDDLDFNIKSFRSNTVLRWEWRPGSTLYLVWQQNRSADELASERVSAGDLFRSFGATGDHSFAVKASFWISPR